MNIFKNPRPVTGLRWNGTSVLFQIEVAGRPVACAISRAALEEVCGGRYIAAGDLLRRFTDRRDRIEAIAASIFAVRPNSVIGTLHIWADDVDDPPSAPAVALQIAEVRA